jgi:hypothetical protein
MVVGLPETCFVYSGKGGGGAQCRSSEARGSCPKVADERTNVDTVGKRFGIDNAWSGQGRFRAGALESGECFVSCRTR